MAANMKRKLNRNACTECRSHKVACVASQPSSACDRCARRDLSCSYVVSPGSATFEAAPVSHKRGGAAIFGQYEYHRNGLFGSHDIGSGTAAEILRETELTYELILLYFSNFDDIHFMFDKDAFLRQYVLGEIPKIILYSVMALGIRYSKLPIFDSVPCSHRGESLFREARKLLKEEFDQTSLTAAQVYVLVSTYHLTFGGARKAWVSLGSASIICKILRLADDSLEPDPLRRELNTRLLNTVVMMDRTLSPSLNMTSFFSPSEAIPTPCDDEEMASIKLRSALRTPRPTPENLIAAIVRMSQDFSEICLYHRHGGTNSQWLDMERRHTSWPSSLHISLHYTQENFVLHRTKGTLRRFVYLHLLHHHAGQLIYFQHLKSNGNLSAQDTYFSAQQALKCQAEAGQITRIVHACFTDGAFDVHNVSIGQILTVAAVVHIHARLTSGARGQGEASQAALVVINDCFKRIREHCRIFDRMASQLDVFLRICSQSSTSRRVFNKNERLIQHMLHYGSAYERLNFRNAGRTSGIDEPSRPSSPSPSPVEYEDWLATTLEPSETSFQNVAWLYSDASLNDIYSMSFADPVSTMGSGEAYQPFLG